MSVVHDISERDGVRLSRFRSCSRYKASPLAAAGPMTTPRIMSGFTKSDASIKASVLTDEYGLHLAALGNAFGMAPNNVH